jgi:hypothetical protein
VASTRVGQREDDRVRRHRLHVLHGEDVCHGYTQEDVRALHRVGQRALYAAGVRAPRQPALGVRHVRTPARVEDARTVHHQDVAGPFRKEHPGAGSASGAAARDHDPHFLHPLADDAERIVQGGDDDDGGAVLVVVKDGDVQLTPQP